MQVRSTHGGEMSQDSIMTTPHLTNVPPPATDPKTDPVDGPVVDPVARQTRRAFNALSMSSVGLEFGLSVVIGALLGRWLDAKAGTGPWLMLAFIVLGFVAGVRSLMRATRKLDRDAKGEHG